ncbi:MAG: ATP synthase F1 subunit gamma [Bacillota bacterium]
MQSPRELRRHIRTIREIQHLTRAMKLVAAAKLREAQARVEAARPFARKISEVLLDISSFAGYVHPLMAGRPPHTTGVMVVTSDRGMCGRYNDDIIKAALDLIDRTGGRAAARVIAVGRVGGRALRELGIPILEERSLASKRPTFALARSIAARILKSYDAGDIDHVYLVYSRFYSAMEQRPRVFRLVPIVPVAGGGTDRLQAGACLFEPSAKEIVDHLVTRYMQIEVYRALLEAEAGERGARMTAMSAASDNASDIIGRLTLTFHRSRQSLITREIADIVGGAEALSVEQSVTDGGPSTGAESEGG